MGQKNIFAYRESSEKSQAALVKVCTILISSDRTERGRRKRKTGKIEEEKQENRKTEDRENEGEEGECRGRKWGGGKGGA